MLTQSFKKPTNVLVKRWPHHKRTQFNLCPKERRYVNVILTNTKPHANSVKYLRKPFGQVFPVRKFGFCKLDSFFSLVESFIHRMLEVSWFYGILILCIEPKSPKTALFANLGTLNFVHLNNFCLQKVQKYLKINIQSL